MPAHARDVVNEIAAPMAPLRVARRRPLRGESSGRAALTLRTERPYHGSVPRYLRSDVW